MQTPSKENMEDFYLTLFSNTSQQIYPNNSTSKFTLKLPKPVILNGGDWCVGLTECHHPSILGSVDGNSIVDEIVFPLIEKAYVYRYDLQNLVMFMLAHAAKPELYTKRYFNEFLDLERLKNFDVDEKINEAKVPLLPDHPKSFCINFYTVASEYRGDIKKTGFWFQSERKYTMKQLIWIILKTYYDVFIDAKKNPSILGVYGLLMEGKTVAEMLQLYALTFVNAVRVYSDHFSRSVTESNYLLIYSDFVDQSVCGNTLSRLLYITNRKNAIEEDVINVQNVRYIPIAKNYIEDMSFFFSDERSRQIIFESGFKPTLIVLHFKRAGDRKNI